MLGNSVVVIQSFAGLKTCLTFLAFSILFGCSIDRHPGPTGIVYTSSSESDPIITVSVGLHHERQETALLNRIVEVLEKYPKGFIRNVYGHSVERMLVSLRGKSVKLELRPLGSDEYARLTDTEKAEREIFKSLRDQLLKVSTDVTARK